MPDEAAEPTRNPMGQFAPGANHNPGGRAACAMVNALARRYTVDAFRGLLWVSRLRDARYAAAISGANQALLAYGYPGALKPAEDGAADGPGRLHLLALTQAQAEADAVADAAEQAARGDDDAAAEREPLTIDLDALPEPEDDLPMAGLELWEASRAYRAAQAARESDNPGPEGPQSGAGGEDLPPTAP